MRERGMTPEEMRRALWGVVANRAQKVRRRKNSRSLWWHVHRVTALGSTLSQRLCVEMGFDPETGEQRVGFHDLSAARPSCTGMTAFWCPVCGDCTCERYESGECEFQGDAAAPRCPLHCSASRHASEEAA